MGGVSDSHGLGGYNRALCKCSQPRVARFTGLGLLREGIPEERCERPSPKSLGLSLQSGQEGEALGLHPHPLTQPPEDFLRRQESPSFPPGEYGGHSGHLLALFDTHTDELDRTCPQYLGWAGGKARVHTVPSLSERGYHRQDQLGAATGEPWRLLGGYRHGNGVRRAWQRREQTWHGRCAI